jgi:hypothetical protein
MVNDFFGGFGGDGWNISVGTGTAGGGWYGGAAGGGVYYPPYPNQGVFGAGMHPQTQQMLMLGAVVLIAYLILK